MTRDSEWWISGPVEPFRYEPDPDDDPKDRGIVRSIEKVVCPMCNGLRWTPDAARKPQTCLRCCGSGTVTKEIS